MSLVFSEIIPLKPLKYSLFKDVLGEVSLLSSALLTLKACRTVNEAKDENDA